MQKASLPKGTRDFSPDVLKRRNKIISVITKVYARYGFEPLQTPAVENLSTLTGKYGEEGDKLLFKILNSGNFLTDVKQEQLSEALENPNSLVPMIAGKGLRYDLTIPFARFVVQNRNDLQFPFKRYQIQPVWRADRPQKGRYREFWQCDADVIGTKSLLCEAEFIKVYHEVFTVLKLANYEIKINHRKILESIALTLEFDGNLTHLTVAIDKLDKIGWEGVRKELLSKGMRENQVSDLKELLIKSPLNSSVIDSLEHKLKPCEQTTEGINALREIISLLDSSQNTFNIQLDLSLARGLDYYTGCIFEATIHGASVGSVSGGGRYDDLTGVFGMPDVSGVGISFGLDRLYDVMQEAQLFSKSEGPTASMLLCHFDKITQKRCISIADSLRTNDISVEVYPDHKNLRKQLDYANKRGYSYVGVIGESELEDEVIQVKDMRSGEQKNMNLNTLTQLLK
jgi:histidyl-tRNA synthetase